MWWFVLILPPKNYQFKTDRNKTIFPMRHAPSISSQFFLFIKYWRAHLFNRIFFDLATSDRALVDQIKSNCVNIALIFVFSVSVEFGKSRASQLYSTAAIMMMMMLGGRVPMCVCRLWLKTIGNEISNSSDGKRQTIKPAAAFAKSKTETVWFM